MKKLQYFLTLIISLTSFIFFFQTVSAEEREITVKNKLAIQEEKSMRIPLTDTAITLNGPYQEKTFYYEIESTTSRKDNALVLYTRSSDLLIDPSAVTVHIDGVPVVSKPLDGKTTRRKIVVPLEGKALEKGIHSVTVSFSGILKEGICVVQESSANWFAIDIQSYFKLSGQSVEKSYSLKDYPHRFIGTEKWMTTLILPNEPSDDTRDNGMKIAAYLVEQSGDQNSVQVVREDQARQMPGDIIIVGAKSEFDSSFIKDVIKQAEVPTKKDGLSLVRTRFVEDTKGAEVLLVIGESAEAMKERIPVLLKDRFIEQLSGERLVIQKVPKTAEDNQYKIPLKKTGMSNVTLDRAETESERFFYYAPQALQQNSGAFLQLYVKRSETLSKLEGIEESVTLHPDVELTVYINDVPHSVDVRALEEGENNVYTVQIPITAKPLSDSHLTSIQFKVSGLGKKDPCIETDENHWVYIMEDSFLSIPDEFESTAPTLAKFPSPFIEQEDETIVVYSEEMTDADLLSFYRSVYIVGKIPNWRLVRADLLSEQDVTEAHLVFLSGVKTQALLQEVAEKLLVPYESGMPSLTPFGFVQEVAKQVAWIQVSPWNENRAMVVFDRLDEKGSYIKERLLAFLRDTDERATIAVQGDGKEIYTNALQVEEMKETGAKQLSNERSTFSIWSVFGFIALILTVILLLLLVLRRQGKAKE